MGQDFKNEHTNINMFEMVVGVSLSIPKSLILVIFGDASEIKVSLSAS